MKIFVTVLAVLAISTYANSAALSQTGTSESSDPETPTRLVDVDADGGLDKPESSPILVRNRRLTCDLFSFESGVVTPNHSACALKCIGKGRKGGHCEGTSCICRDDKWTPWS